MSDSFTISASGKASIVKDPNAVLDYIFDWTEWLDANGDTIVDKDVAVTGEVGSTIAVDQAVIAGASKKVIAWVSGGTPGETCALRCRITTSNAPARIDDRTVYLKIKER